MRAALAASLALSLVLTACGDDDDGPSADASVDATPCGLPGPGSRCASVTTLERCEGADIVTVDCAAEGRVCGADPAHAAGGACVADGDGCGVIVWDGVCTGTVLTFCDGGVLEVSDCAETGRVCGWAGDDVGFDCISGCEADGVPVEGRCVGTTAVERCEWVDGNYVAVTETCEGGAICTTVPETGWPGCLVPGPCASVGPAGACDGALLSRCDGTSLLVTDCAASGRVCAYGGDAAGYVCAEPGTVGALAVTGRVQYEDRSPLESGGLGALVPAPARGVSVAVVTEGGDVLAAAVTADDGSYTLRHDAAAGTAVHVLAATSSARAERPVRVLRPDGLVHGFASASFAAAPDVTVEVLVTDASGIAEAFNVFDQIVVGIDVVRVDLEIAALDEVYAVWIRGTEDGTYYDFSRRAIFLLGLASDDDGYDDAVILHEFGHYLEDRYGRSDSPGGGHDGTPTDPRLAWSEGFSTWTSCALRGTSFYMDSNAAGGWGQDIDSGATAADPDLDDAQPVSELMVQEILWDVSDGGDPDDDPMTTGGVLPVLRVQPKYLRSAAFVDRGHAGADLVDWLDGWFYLEGLGACAPVRGVVTEARSFPYDYAGPGGACP